MLPLRRECARSRGYQPRRLSSAPTFPNGVFNEWLENCYKAHQVGLGREFAPVPTCNGKRCVRLSDGVCGRFFLWLETPWVKKSEKENRLCNHRDLADAIDCAADPFRPFNS